MRILILSDLHDDFWAECGRNPFDGMEAEISSLDHVLLAGDISNKPKVRWTPAFQRLAKLIPLDRVSVFPGNHDFYDFRLDGEDCLKAIAASVGVSYVQKKELIFGDARILSATLWTDLELGATSAINANLVSARMNDYKQIRVASKGFRKLLPSDVVLQHRDHLAWLTEKLRQPFSGKTYVATHHAPYQGVLQDSTDSLAPAYTSDLSDIIEQYAPTAWFFGHSHSATGMTLGKTSLRNVSLGYPDEVSDPSLRIKNCIFEI